MTLCWAWNLNSYFFFFSCGVYVMKFYWIFMGITFLVVFLAKNIFLIIMKKKLVSIQSSFCVCFQQQNSFILQEDKIAEAFTTLHQMKPLKLIKLTLHQSLCNIYEAVPFIALSTCSTVVKTFLDCNLLCEKCMLLQFSFHLLVLYSVCSLEVHWAFI